MIMRADGKKRRGIPADDVARFQLAKQAAFEVVQSHRYPVIYNDQIVCLANIYKLTLGQIDALKIALWRGGYMVDTQPMPEFQKQRARMIGG
jgi:hypothetical protein